VSDMPAHCYRAPFKPGGCRFCAPGHQFHVCLHDHEYLLRLRNPPAGTARTHPLEVTD
jgi:hypothetical protein